MPELLTQFNTTPGISSFVGRSHELAASLLPPIQQAAAAVHAHSHKNVSHIPIYLGATAGMRALTDAARDDVMAAVRHALASSGCPFAFERAEQARVLSGEEEGAFGWLTANALADSLSSDPITTFGTLDMGGASAQVSFLPMEVSVLANMFPMHFGSFQKGPIHLYTHSYQDYGYVHAFQRSASLLLQDSAGRGVVEHPCLPRGLRWHVNTEDFGVGSNPERATGAVDIRGSGNFEECRALARSSIEKVECTTKPCAILGVYQPKLNVSQFVFLGEFVAAFERMGIAYHDPSAPPLRALSDGLAEWCPMTVEELGQVNDESLGSPGAKLELACFLGVWCYEFLTYGIGFPVDFLGGGRGPYSWALGQAIYEVNFFPYRIVAATDSLELPARLELFANVGKGEAISVQAAVAVAAVGIAVVFGAITGVAVDRRREVRSSIRAPLLDDR